MRDLYKKLVLKAQHPSIMCWREETKQKTHRENGATWITSLFAYWIEFGGEEAPVTVPMHFHSFIIDWDAVCLFGKNKCIIMEWKHV